MICGRLMGESELNQGLRDKADCLGIPLQEVIRRACRAYLRCPARLPEGSVVEEEE